MDKKDLKDKVARALEIDLPYFNKPETLTSVKDYVKNNPHRPASVILCLSCPQKEDQLEDLKLLFTTRTDEMPSHAGQISFPGGRQQDEESIIDCALRENFEEVGIEKEKLEILGSMPIMPSLISRYYITPVISCFKEPLAVEKFDYNPKEVSEVFLVRLGDLVSEKVFQVSDREYKGIRYPLYEFLYEDYRIWGLTAHLTANFLKRMGLL